MNVGRKGKNDPLARDVRFIANSPVRAAALVRGNTSTWTTIVALLCMLGALASSPSAAGPNEASVAPSPRDHERDRDGAGPRIPGRMEATPDDDSRQKLQSLERDVDVIQNRLIRSDAPFYRTSSFWISVAALMFSIGSTVWSSRRDEAQDVRAARQELRGLLQRLAALPKENVEAVQKYAHDPLTANLVGSMIAQENSLLARQASDIARTLPKNIVSPTEYYAIAMALENAYEYDTTRDLLERSIATARDRSDFISEISASRALGYLLFIVGKPDEGRDTYRNARAIFTRYPAFDPYTQVNTHFLTELNWASAETIARSNALVCEHLDAAGTLLEGLNPSPGRDNMQNQLDQARTRFGAMGMIPKPTVPAMEQPVMPASGAASA